MTDDVPGRDTIELARSLRDAEKKKMEQPAPEGAQARMQQMLRDNMGAHGDYVDHGAKFINRVFSERGLFAVLFIGLMVWNMRASHVANEALRADNKQLAVTVKALAYQGEEQGEQLEDMNETLAELTSELHDANLVRRYSAPQFRTNPFQNPQEQTNGRSQR